MLIVILNLLVLHLESALEHTTGQKLLNTVQDKHVGTASSTACTVANPHQQSIDQTGSHGCAGRRH